LKKLVVSVLPVAAGWKRLAAPSTMAKCSIRGVRRAAPSVAKRMEKENGSNYVQNYAGIEKETDGNRKRETANASLDLQ
jgi:hypothetical protein